MSAVPPFPLAGFPSQTAIIRSDDSTTRPGRQICVLIRAGRPEHFALNNNPPPEGVMLSSTSLIDVPEENRVDG